MTEMYVVTVAAVGLRSRRGPDRLAYYGERVPLAAGDAARLIGLGAVVPADNPDAPPPPAPPRPRPAVPVDPPRRDAKHRYLRDDPQAAAAARAEADRYLHDLVLATIYGGRGTPPGIGYHPRMRACGHKTPGENAAEAMRDAGPNREDAR